MKYYLIGSFIVAIILVVIIVITIFSKKYVITRREKKLRENKLQREMDSIREDIELN